MTIRRCFLLVPFLVTFYSCKVAKVAPKSSEQNVSKDLYKRHSENLKADTIPKTQIDSLLIDSLEIKDVEFIRNDTLEIIGVGDIMMGTNFPESKYLPPHDGKYLLQDVDSILMDADITFGNLEGVILNEGGDPKNCNNPDLCYLFRSPESYAGHLVNAGFDLVSVANNHAGDFGDPGRANTKKVLDSLGIKYAGFLDKPFVMFQSDSIKYGFAAFSPNTGTMSINDIPAAVKIIQLLDSLSDVVIVSFHGGAEGKDYRHVTRKTEFFYGENRGNVYEFAHTLIDNGADIVFGHGPHVTRAMEIYKERFIAYSLGNFCTYARFNLRGSNGLAPIVKVFTNTNGKFIKGQIYPIIQTGSGVPKIDSQKRVIQELIELTKEDFPEVKISIDPSGIITYIDKESSKD